MVYDRTAHARRTARRPRARLPACDLGPSCTGRRARPQRSRLLRLCALRARRSASAFSLPRSFSRAMTGFRGERRRPATSPLILLLPPVAFVVQEFLERLHPHRPCPVDDGVRACLPLRARVPAPVRLGRSPARVGAGLSRARGRASAGRCAPADLFGLCPRSRARRRGSAPRRPRARLRRTRAAFPSLTVVSVGRAPRGLERRSGLKRSSIALAVVLIALAAAPSAFAHAILQESTPSNDMVVRQSPPTVTLRFNEAVETAFGSIRVYNCGGARVDSGKISRPDDRMVAIKLDRQAPSRDLHGHVEGDLGRCAPGRGRLRLPRRGGGSRPAPARRCSARARPARSTALFKFARALDFALILLVVGGARRSRSSFARPPSSCVPASTGSSPGSRSVVVIAGILCIVLQGAVAGGFGLSEAFRWNTVDSVLQTHFGKAFLFQLAFAAIVAPVAFIAGQARNAALGALTLVPALCLLPTLSAAGHARTSGTVALRRRPDPHGGGVDLGRRARLHDSRPAPRRRRPLAARRPAPCLASRCSPSSPWSRS